MPFSTDFVPPLGMARGRVSRYLLALGVVIVATLLRLVSEPLLHDQMPFFMYVGSVVVATWFGGWESGVIATVLSAYAANYFFSHPRFDFGVSARDLAEMSVFGAVSLSLVFFTARWRRAEQELRLLHAESTAHANELEVILDAVPAAVFVTRDAQVRRMEGNRLAAEVLGSGTGHKLVKDGTAGGTTGEFSRLEGRK